MVKVRAYRTLENALRRMGFMLRRGMSTRSVAAVSPGPVVAGGGVLDPDRYIPRICDSKTVTALERDRLYDQITREAMAWSVVGVEPEEIDRINIHQASLRAMQRAVLAWRRCPTWCWSTRFAFPICRWRSAASCTATAGARPSPRPRSWPRSRAIG